MAEVNREPFEPGLMPGMLLIVLVLVIAIIAELSTCGPRTYDRNGDVIQGRICGGTR